MSSNISTHPSPALIFIDNEEIYSGLLPLTFTRPVSELLIGLSTIREKWQHYFNMTARYRTAEFLSELFPGTEPERGDLLIASDLLPDDRLAEAVAALPCGGRLTAGDRTLAERFGSAGDEPSETVYDGEILSVSHPYDLFLLNSRAIESDFRILTAGRRSRPLSPSCTVIGDPGLVFIEEGGKAEGAFINTNNGPVYIGRNAEVMEGSCLRGPVALLEHATVNMGSRIYGATTIGAWCKVGGEINNAVIHPYSNKAHDGFLGNAVIGSWCNIGAGCVASNLKNDYTEIKLWDYASRRFARTGLQFCGLIMGDHSKAGINTMFNTATVTGVGVNIHGTGFPRNFIASFSEGSAGTGFTDVPMSKFFSIAQRMMARRGIEMTDADRRLFNALHDLTEVFR